MSRDSERLIAKAGAGTLKQTRPGVEQLLGLNSLLYVTGTTAQSCSIRVVLGSLCWHLASLAGVDVSCIPGDYSGLVSYFHRMLKVSFALIDVYGFSQNMTCTQQ